MLIPLAVEVRSKSNAKVFGSWHRLQGISIERILMDILLMDILGLFPGDSYDLAFLGIE